MRRAALFFRGRYGSNPLHLLGHLVVFAIAGYALDQIISNGSPINFLFWFGGAAVLHDVVFLPIYSVLDRVGGAGARRLHVRLPGGKPHSPGHVPLVNHLRAPALVSGVLLLIYFPLILGPSDPAYFRATGHHPQGYLRNWALITVALFAGSAAVYAARVWIRRRDRGSSRV